MLCIKAFTLTGSRISSANRVSVTAAFLELLRFVFVCRKWLGIKRRTGTSSSASTADAPVQCGPVWKPSREVAPGPTFVLLCSMPAIAGQLFPTNI